MKEIFVKDENAVAKWTEEYLRKVSESPEKYMPLCTLCGVEKSNILMAHSPEGEARIALFGVCKKCCPDDVTDEIVKKVMEKVKPRIINGEGTVHITPTEWQQ